jgi:dienelactone hydrolase
MFRAWAIACLLMLAMPLSAGAAGGSTIAIPSETPSALPQFLAKTAPAATVRGELFLPAGAGPFPAMVLKHDSAGVSGAGGVNLRAWATTLAGWGVAALIVDSFGPRGIAGTSADQNKLSPWADVADSFAALRVLAADPRIDKTRIGIMGWSRGGSVAYDTALDTARKAMIDGDLKFAAHIVLYGSAEAQYRDSATDRSPLLVLHGASDDHVSIDAAREYANWLGSMGGRLTFISYPHAYHEFDVANGPSGFRKDLQVGLHCDLVVDLTTGQVTRMGHKPVTAQVTLPRIVAYYKTCVTRGATLQYDAAARADAVDKVHQFLKDDFHLTQ